MCTPLLLGLQQIKGRPNIVSSTRNNNTCRQLYFIFNDQYIDKRRYDKSHYKGPSSQKKIEDRYGKERVFHCQKCTKNHLGKDCDGNSIECNYCGKKGHWEYECYTKKRLPNQ